MAEQTVDVEIAGMKVRGLRVMTAKYKGCDVLTGLWFKPGDQIAFIHQDRLTPEQKRAIYPNGKVYHVCVQWPLKDRSAAKAKPSVAIPPDSIFERGSGIEEVAKPEPEVTLFEPSQKQLAILNVVLKTEDNILIDAKAGSGKTTTLIWLMKEVAKRGLLQGKKVIYLAFNKKIETELSARLQGTGVPAQTTHAFGLRLLQKYFGGNNIKPCNGKVANEAFLKIVCDDNGLGYFAESFKQARKSGEYALRKPVLALVGFIKNWGIFPIYNDGWVYSKAQEETIREFIEIYEIEYPKTQITAEDLVRLAIRVVVRTCPEQGKMVTEVDFDDLLFLIHVLPIEFPHYDLVLTDESQDFASTQVLLVEKLIQN